MERLGDHDDYQFVIPDMAVILSVPVASRQAGLTRTVVINGTQLQNNLRGISELRVSFPANAQTLADPDLSIIMQVERRIGTGEQLPTFGGTVNFGSLDKAGNPQVPFIAVRANAGGITLFDDVGEMFKGRNVTVRFELSKAGNVGLLVETF
jgi:hypothetical protein